MYRAAVVDGKIELKIVDGESVRDLSVDELEAVVLSFKNETLQSQLHSVASRRLLDVHEKNFEAARAAAAEKKNVAEPESKK